jgi:Fe-S-cluster-containing hydrogenase component 2
MCVTACPFGAITLVDGYPIKCDLCDGEPACTRLCEPGAITLGDDEGMGLTQRLLLAGKVREAYLAK